MLKTICKNRCDQKNLNRQTDLIFVDDPQSLAGKGLPDERRVFGFGPQVFLGEFPFKGWVK